MMRLIRIFVFTVFSLASMSCESAEFDSDHPPRARRTRTVAVLTLTALALSSMPEHCHADADADLAMMHRSWRHMQDKFAEQDREREKSVGELYKRVWEASAETTCPEPERPHVPSTYWKDAVEEASRFSGPARKLFSEDKVGVTFLDLMETLQYRKGEASRKLYLMAIETRSGSVIAAHRLGRFILGIESPYCASINPGVRNDLVNCFNKEELNKLAEFLCATA